MTKKTILLLLATLNICFAFSQNTFKAILKNSTTQENLVGVTAVHKGTSKGASSNVNGEVTEIHGQVFQQTMQHHLQVVLLQIITIGC